MLTSLVARKVFAHFQAYPADKEYHQNGKNGRVDWNTKYKCTVRTTSPNDLDKVAPYLLGLSKDILRPHRGGDDRRDDTTRDGNREGRKEHDDRDDHGSSHRLPNRKTSTGRGDNYPPRGHDANPGREKRPAERTGRGDNYPPPGHDANPGREKRPAERTGRGDNYPPPGHDANPGREKRPAERRRSRSPLPVGFDGPPDGDVKAYPANWERRRYRER